MKLVCSLFLIFMVTACAEKTMQGGPMNEAPVGVTGTMTLFNRTKLDIENVHITRCNDRTNSMRRNEDTIVAGGKYTFRLSPGCWVMRIGNRSARHSFGVMAEQDFVIDYSGK